MRNFYFRLPALVCFLISFIALLGSVRSSKWWAPIFYAFLPGCILYMTSLMIRMERELSRLRRRVSRLEQKGQPAANRPVNRPATPDRQLGQEPKSSPAPVAD